MTYYYVGYSQVDGEILNNKIAIVLFFGKLNVRSEFETG